MFQRCYSVTAVLVIAVDCLEQLAVAVLVVVFW